MILALFLKVLINFHDSHYAKANGMSRSAVSGLGCFGFGMFLCLFRMFRDVSVSRCFGIFVSHVSRAEQFCFAMFRVSRCFCFGCFACFARGTVLCRVVSGFAPRNVSHLRDSPEQKLFRFALCLCRTCFSQPSSEPGQAN